MSTSNPQDWLTIVSAEGSFTAVPAPDATDSERLHARRQAYAQFLHKMLRVIPAEVIIDMYNDQGWPDLDTPPPSLTAEQRAELERRAKEWGDQSRAEADELWRQRFPDLPPPPHA